MVKTQRGEMKEGVLKFELIEVSLHFVTACREIRSII